MVSQVTLLSFIISSENHMQFDATDLKFPWFFFSLNHFLRNTVIFLNRVFCHLRGNNNSYHLFGHTIPNDILNIGTKWPMCVLQGLRNAREIDCKALCWSFLQGKKRHKFLLRLSRKPHPWTKIKKRKLQAFLWVNANKILTEVFSS